MSKQAATKTNKPPRIYRKELLKKKAEFLTAIGSNFKTLSGSGPTSEEDLIMVSQEQVVGLGMNRVFYEQLRQVESAIRRLDLGQFGDCSRCGSPISSKRLQAVPWTSYCVDCQDKTTAEDEQEVFGPRIGGNHVAASENSHPE